MGEWKNAGLLRLWSRENGFALDPDEGVQKLICFDKGETLSGALLKKLVRLWGKREVRIVLHWANVCNRLKNNDS